MESASKLNGENPLESASLPMKLFFAWMIKIFYKGYRKGIGMKDLFQIRRCDRSDLLADKLGKNWEKEVERANANGGKPSLLRAITQTFLPKYMFHGAFLFVQVVGIKMCEPLVLGHLIRLFRTKDEGENLELYLTGAILVVVVTTSVFFQHHLNFAHQTIGMRLRISVSALIYRKMLRLNKKMLTQNDVGQIVNLLANDVNRFDCLSVILHHLWITPFQVMVLIYFLWDHVGVVSLACIFASMIITVFPAAFGKKTLELRRKVAEKTDYRVRLMNDLISGMQVIKMYAWEKPYEAIIRAARLDEVKSIRTANCLRGLLLTPKIFLQRTNLYLTAVTYVLMGNEITAEKMYTLTIFLNLMHISLAVFFPYALQWGAEALVSVRRLHHFLLLEENQASNIERGKDGRVALEKVDASWTKDLQTLRNISLDVPAGSLCVIIGKVGSGKSSLLYLLLGELQAKTGTVKVGGEVSYASQEPWLFSSSVRNNILFGQEYNKRRYAEVVYACALEKDFKQFPEGDQSIVGEKGMSLSGGQRARINLARAIYREADVYVVDDPLSAVDAHVGNHLFQECILDYLKSKTRILVTHQLQFLKKADLIAVVDDGMIQSKGTFEELSKAGLDFAQVLASTDETTKEEVDDSSAIRDTNELNGPKETSGNEEKIVKMTTSAMKEYVLSAGNSCMLMLTLLVIVFNHLVVMAVDLWVRFWSDQEERKHSNLTIAQELKDYEEDTYLSVYIYSGLIFLLIVLTMVRSLLFYRAASVASRNLHARMFSSLLQAPMRFFDTNPSGRVLNRFCKDMGAIDEMLPRVLSEAVEISLGAIGVIIIISISNYYTIIAILFLTALLLILVKCFNVTARVIRHVEGVTKSPVFSHLNATANGISTIRASSAEQNLTIQFDELQDVHTSVWFLTISCMESFGLWLDLLVILLLACVVFSFILASQIGEVSGANVGLAVSQSLFITGELQFGMKQLAEVINQLASVERVMEYTALEKEGDFETSEEKQPPKGWPKQGDVSFNDVHMSYAPTGPKVLKNLSFSVLNDEKIGIVGRTGAGKSSLVSALFRLTPFKGCIMVDGIDTKTLGLNDVRKRISIIPQKPVLFSATVRYNLDPFGEYEDKDLWNALEEVELKDAIPSLEFQVDEGGSNFSVGQRQLICLARAIVRDNKILVLDEATSNVDPKTDVLIQRTIRRKFKECTVLTIAHRLNTIMNSDKILVVDDGQMVEFGHPQTLLENPEGYFAKLVDESGQKMAPKDNLDKQGREE